MQNNSISTVMLVVLASVGSQANAAMTETKTFDLNNFPAAIYGDANMPPTASGLCDTTGDIGGCYGKGDTVGLNAPNYVVIGTVRDNGPSGGGAHLHSDVDELDATNTMIHTHADAGGIYFRMRDQSAFSFLSMNVFAPEGNVNPDPDGYFEILGFSDAVNYAGANSDLVAGDGTNYANRVAYQTLPATFDYSDPNSPLLLNSDFGNVNAVWIHFGGWGKVPYDPDQVIVDGEVISDGPLTAPVFNLYVDNIKLSTPVLSSVPVPAAVWMFGSGLLGLISLGRRKTV